MADGAVLVTGGGGFVGRYLIEALREQGRSICAMGREPRPMWLAKPVQWVQADLLTGDGLNDLARDWTAIIHLAGRTVPSQFKTPADVASNLIMTQTLLEHVLPTRILKISSAHVYGPARSALRETDALRPQGRYGASKLYAEQAMLLANDHFDVRIARPFNHIGTGMQPDLMIPSLIRRIRTQAQTNEPLVMQGQDSDRDYLDVRDIISAYLAILDLDAPKERIFNVCSGQATSVSTIAQIALEAAGQQREIVFTQQANSSDDRSVLIGDPTRLMTTTGWKPQISLSQSLQAAFASP
jgi:GDP-4-dehydro-6-deoxy-D-mannose reductase